MPEPVFPEEKRTGLNLWLEEGVSGLGGVRAVAGPAARAADLGGMDEQWDGGVDLGDFMAAKQGLT